MTDSLTIDSMTPIPPMPETLDLLDIVPGGFSTVACYRFTATGSGNTGTACFTDGIISLEWGGDPDCYYADDTLDDEANLVAALTGELPPCNWS